MNPLFLGEKKLFGPWCGLTGPLANDFPDRTKARKVHFATPYLVNFWDYTEAIATKYEHV
jgi:hypothetical protein